jgi:hypothetical protein
MTTDLRDKLRRLGVHKGARNVKPPLPADGRQGDLESLVDGYQIDTPFGSTFVHDETYTADHAHGDHTLGEWLGLPSATAAAIANEPALEQIDLSRVVFLDTETTGLSGGTGTLIFLVGVGAFHSPLSNLQPPTSSFRIRQFFLRSPGEELAMLHALAEWLDGFDASVSFNGRGFDLPLLASRFTLARMKPKILHAPHLDLLAPARRVWRGRLPSCALSSLEQHILNVRREQADVPGFLIPEMYMNYVRTRDAGEMPRVLYHNAIDILSMVALSTRLIRLFDRTQTDGRDAGDWLALARWHDDRGRVGAAESALRACLAARPDPATRDAALHRLGHLLKRLARYAEAVRVWQTLSESRSWQGVEACIELAKHSEWREANTARAAAWTREAIILADALPASYARDRIVTELAHRQRRLGRKR